MASLRHSLLLALGVGLLAAAMYLPWLGRLQLRLEEPTHALVARTIVAGGDPLVPTAGGRAYTAKPPLFAWLIAGASAPAGRVTETSARLPSVVCLALLGAFLVVATHGVLGPAGQAFLGAGAVLAREFSVKVVLAETDVAFTLLVTLALWTWFRLERRWPESPLAWVVPGVFAGLAFLTKREPGLVFVWLSVGGYLVWTGRRADLVSGRALAGLVVSLAIAGVWPAAVAWQLGPGALWESLRDQVLERGLPRSAGEIARHLLGYPLEMLGAMLPFSLVLPLLLFPLARRAVHERYGDAFTFAACTVAFNFPVYWLRGDVAVRYVLPLFPPALVVAAMVFERWAAGALALPHGIGAALGRLPRAIAWGLLAAGGALALVAVLDRARPDLPVLVPWPLGVGLGLALVAAGGALRAVASARPAPALLAALAAVAVTVRLFYFTAGLPRTVARVERRENARGIAAAIAARGDRVDVLGAVPRAVWFYAPPDLLRPLARPRRHPPAAGRLVLFDETHSDLVAGAVRAWETLERFPFRDAHLVLGRVTVPGAYATH